LLLSVKKKGKIKMANLKNFFNAILNDDRIFTREDIKSMSNEDFANNELAIDFQLHNLGIPTNFDLSNNSDVVYVHSYVKDDGTEVRAHFRRRPGRFSLNDDGAVTGYASRVQKTSADFSEFERKYNLCRINAEKNANRPNAREMFNLFLVGLDKAPKSDEYMIVDNKTVKNLNKALKMEASEVDIDKNWKGVVYNKDSLLSYNLSNSPQLKRQVIDAYNKKGRFSKKDKIFIELNEDKNLHYSIGHGTILNPTVDSKGNFKGLLFDKYDFAFMKNFLEGSETVKYNDIAWAIQEFRKINPKNCSNYYVFVPVMFKVK